MSEVPEPRRWSYQVGARLKLVQASCRDWSADKRRAALAQEFDHVIKEVPQERQGEYLRELTHRFPTGTPLPPNPSQIPDPEQTDAPDKILNDFVMCCANLPAEQRASFIAYLEDVGLIERSEPAAEDPLSSLGNQLELKPTDAASIRLVLESLKLSLQLDIDKPIDIYRLIRVFRWMLEAFGGLEDLVWRAWGEIAPASKLSPSHLPLREAVAQYVAAGDTADPNICSQSIDATTWMTKSITNGLGRGGKNFSDELFHHLAPEAIIEQTQKSGGRSAFQGEGARCWEEYTKLFDQIDPAYLEQWLRTRVAEVAEEWFHCEQENA